MQMTLHTTSLSRRSSNEIRAAFRTHASLCIPQFFFLSFKLRDNLQLSSGRLRDLPLLAHGSHVPHGFD